ncbi:MAG: tol-pal system-associated acyl-CoA thioesterase [Proteobacteria bacterium]|nr:tol-pal system-associated acyl-CoA thioesterase [Pseudomonadota bacterium]
MSFNFSAQYRIYYEDTDAGGIVYYANYLKFFERARTDFLRSLQISQSQLLTEEKLAFVVRRCEIDYIASAKLDDLIDVSVLVKEITAVSIVMQQDISKTIHGTLLEKQNKKQILSHLKVEIVCVTTDSFGPKKIPQNIKKLFDAR